MAGENATHKYEGKKIKYTPSGTAVTAGDVIVLVDLVAIATVDIAVGQLGWLATEGVFEIPKATGTPMPVGTIVYWDDTADAAKTTDGSGAHKRAGKVWESADSGDTTVIIKLNAV